MNILFDAWYVCYFLFILLLFSLLLAGCLLITHRVTLSSTFKQIMKNIASMRKLSLEEFMLYAQEEIVQVSMADSTTLSNGDKSMADSSGL